MLSTFTDKELLGVHQKLKRDRDSLVQQLRDILRTMQVFEQEYLRRGGNPDFLHVSNIDLEQA